MHPGARASRFWSTKSLRSLLLMRAASGGGFASRIALSLVAVAAHNKKPARIAEQSRQVEAAARQANDVQEDKIKILSSQMQELIARLDEESRHRARLEAENADLRARSEFPVPRTHWYSSWPSRHQPREHRRRQAIHATPPSGKSGPAIIKPC